MIKKIFSLINLKKKSRLRNYILFFLILICFYIPELKSKDNILIQNCKIEKTKKIPKNSSVILGHAYPFGSENNFIGRTLEIFLKKNKRNFKKIFFTGDVFRIPDETKWMKLHSNFKLRLSNENNIIIAPGNHDVGFGKNKYRNIFIKSPLFIKDFPFKINDNGFDLIIEDSGSNNWLISNKTYNLISETKSNIPLIILRHHIPVKELVHYSNSQAGISEKLPSIKNLEKTINRPLTIISGDGGAFKSQPRLICKEFGNLKIIINGLAEIPEDKIIYIHNKKIYQYTISNSL